MGTNPNTMTFKTVFSAEYQLSHYKKPVYQVLAESSLKAGLEKGQTVSRSYASDVYTNDMGGDGSYSTQAVTDTGETLTISDEKEASIYIKKLDEMQAHLPLKKKYGQKLANALINQIDGDVLLTAYQGAGTTIDDGDFGGTTGNGHTPTASNIATVFTTAMTKLRLNNVVDNNRLKMNGGLKVDAPEGTPIAIITSEMLSYIELYLGGKDTLLGDQVSRNGYSGYFMGFNVLMSNALPATGTLALATNPTDGDTLVINGVTLTFKDTVDAGVTAGQVAIASTVDLTRANLVEFLNLAGNATVAEATNAGYNAVSQANVKRLKNFTWTNDNSADTATFVASGHGTVVVSETLTDATDTFTATASKTYSLFALSKSVSLVIQKDPSVIENPVSGKVGRDYVGWTVYGRKVFVDQAPQIVAYTASSTNFGASSALSK